MRLFSLIITFRGLSAGVLALAMAWPAAAQQSTSPPSETPQQRRTPMPGEGPSKGKPPAPESKNGEVRPLQPAPPAAQSPQGKQATPQGNQRPPGKQIPGIAVTQPRTPAEREKALADLYAILATAETESAAKTVATNIERLWLNSSSDTVALLMERSAEALKKKKPDLAIKILDEVVALAPDYAEGWNRRAYVYFTQNKVQQALGDIRRVLALDPNHFKALDGLVHVLKEIGQKKGALAAVKKLLEVHPYWEGAQAIHDELAREVEGQAL